MKISIRKMFVLLAIVMSFVFVQVGWALDCSSSVTGEITNDPSVDRGIEVNGLTIYGIPDYLNIETGDSITINYSVQPGGDLVACSLMVYSSTIVLRPRTPVQLIGRSVTVAADTDCTCDNCHYNCLEDCPDCTCEMLCECSCDGTGPKGPKGPRK